MIYIFSTLDDNSKKHSNTKFIKHKKTEIFKMLTPAYFFIKPENYLRDFFLPLNPEITCRILASRVIKLSLS